MSCWTITEGEKLQITCAIHRMRSVGWDEVETSAIERMLMVNGRAIAELECANEQISQLRSALHRASEIISQWHDNGRTD